MATRLLDMEANRVPLVGLGACVAFGIAARVIMATPPEVEPPRPPTYRTAWLAGDPEGTHGCLPLFPTLLAHPHWQLQIARGASGCTGDVIHASYQIDADRWVSWQQADMPERRVQLTPQEFTELTTLDQIDCSAPDDDTGWYRVGFGGDFEARAGAYIPPLSATGEYLDRLTKTIRDRYTARRAAELGDFRIELSAVAEGEWTASAARFVVRMTPDRLTVVRGRKTLLDRPVDREAAIELVDYMLQHDPALQAYAFARGFISYRGTSREGISLPAFPYQQPLLIEAIRNAIYSSGLPLRGA